MTEEEMDRFGIHASEYRFELNPDLKVSWRGPAAWAIIEGGACMNRDGGWEYEPQPSSRDEAFMARCRFTLHEALTRAAAIGGFKQEEKHDGNPDP